MPPDNHISPQDLDEQLLLRQLSNLTQRPKAFELVVQLYGQRLYWLIRRIVQIHEDAHDVLQNVFLKAWQGLDDFRGDSKLFTWLYQIALYESLNFVKTRQRRQEMFLSVGEEHSFIYEQAKGPDLYFDGDLAEKKLQAAIQSLPEKQRLAFLLRYYDELPYQEISRITGISVGALKANYHHAEQKIRAFLEQEIKP